MQYITLNLYMCVLLQNCVCDMPLMSVKPCILFSFKLCHMYCALALETFLNFWDLSGPITGVTSPIIFNFYDKLHVNKTSLSTPRGKLLITLSN